MITARTPWEDGDPEVDEAIPSCPDDLIPDREQERLDHELHDRYWAGEFTLEAGDIDEIDQIDLYEAVRLLNRKETTDEKSVWFLVTHDALR